MRRAKIVCTIGPASSDEEMIERLVLAGMNVARLNFSHGSHEVHRQVFDRLCSVRERLERPLAILQDLQGPKIRVGSFRDGYASLTEGQSFTLVADRIEGNNERVSTTYAPLAEDVREGEEILLDDGLLRLLVEKVGPDFVQTRVMVGGILRDKKGMNLPTTRISLPSLTAKDREDLELGIELGVEYVALSFVRSVLDIHQLRHYLPRDATRAPAIIAKIEKPQAVQNLHAIVAAADGVMVARGDLGVELPAEKVPIIQKEILELANRMAKVSITATQMLESMTVNPRPTRAEASDVANAIMDGTDAVMLSAETASGKYPLESVQMMDRVIREVESSQYGDLRRTGVVPAETSRLFSVAISKAAVAAAEELNVSAIACFTISGGTARLIKSERPRRDVVAFTPLSSAFHRMALYRSITPVRTQVRYETDSLLQMVEEELLQRRIARPGDRVIIVMGVPVGVGTPTNTIKFHSIPYPPSDAAGGGERA